MLGSQGSDFPHFMAAWQFDILMLHIEGGPNVPPDACAVVTELLAAKLGSRASMFPDWTYFGAETGNRFDVIKGPHGECELSVRLDARSSETDSFIRLICDAAARSRCTFFSHELNEHFEPSPGAIKIAIQRSAAWQFALGPTSNHS